MGNKVLTSSSAGGIAGFNVSSAQLLTAEQQTGIYRPWLAERTTLFANYAQTCHSDISNGEDYGPCGKTRLSRVVDQDATCPFHDNICRHEDRNIKIDADYLNSITDSGINAPSEG